MEHHKPNCKGGPDCECDQGSDSTTVAELISELEWARDCYGSEAKVAIFGFDECEISVVSNELKDEYPDADILLEC